MMALNLFTKTNSKIVTYINAFERDKLFFEQVHTCNFFLFNQLQIVRNRDTKSKDMEMHSAVHVHE